MPQATQQPSHLQSHRYPSPTPATHTAQAAQLLPMLSHPQEVVQEAETRSGMGSLENLDAEGSARQEHFNSLQGT